MRKNKLPEFTLLLEQFFTEYMPFSSGLSPNTIRSYKHSFRLLFQYIYPGSEKNADEILFRDLDYETIDGFFKMDRNGTGLFSIHKESPAFGARFFFFLRTKQKF